MAGVDYGSLPFTEQIRFFRRKLNLPTRAWTDIYEAEHDHAFVVAGANRDDLVADFRAAIDKAISEGTTLAEFRKDFDQIVATHGWSYHGGRGWRSRVIYDTNLRTSYAAGRYKQLQAVKKDRPYWEFHHTPVAHPRTQHVEWDGLTLAADDPWWQTHYPPIGWGCQCVVYSRSERDLRRRGKDGPDTAPPVEWETRRIGTRGPNPRTVRVPKGVDPGFAYPPGQSWQRAMTPAEAGGALDLGRPIPAHPARDRLPPARVLGRDSLLSADTPDAAAIDAFLAEFDGQLSDTGLFTDAAGSPLAISDALFRDGEGRLKVAKRGRKPYLKVLAHAIMAPDEVWVALDPLRNEPGRYLLRRRYLARYQIEGEAAPVVAVFEWSEPVWDGVTGFKADDLRYLEKQRYGVRLYRRDEEGAD